MRTVWATAMGVALAALAFGTVMAEPVMFEDGERGVVLETPPGSAICPTQAATGDDAAGNGATAFDLGPLVVLDASDAQDCYAADVRRHIARYDGSGLAAPGGSTDQDCLPTPAGCTSLAELLGSPGPRRRLARVIDVDGWIDVVVVTKSDDKRPNAPALTFVLHTDRAHLQVDLSAFKGMLSALANAP